MQQSQKNLLLYVTIIVYVLNAKKEIVLNKLKKK